MGNFVILLVLIVVAILFPLAVLGSLKKTLDKQKKQDETK